MFARLRQMALIGVTLGVLSACSNYGGFSGDPVGNLPQSSNASTEHLLRQASSTSDSDEAAELRLSAAEKAISEQDYRGAAHILRQVPDGFVPPAQQIFGATLQAEIDIHDGNYPKAIQDLNIPAMSRLDELPIHQQVRTHMARANAYAGNKQNLRAAQERIFIGPLLNDSQVADNNEQIWQLVSDLPEHQLAPTGNADLDGWLALASNLHAAQNLQQQQRASDDWMNSHPNHPGTRPLPASLAKLRRLASQPLDKIGLLLPEQGRLAGAAKALRDGFVSASYSKTDDGATAPQITFYDSTQMGSLDDFYRQAQADGVKLVVGPLEKPLVRQLSERQQLPITTLSLNYSDAANPPKQLFQYGLAPEDEARAVAQRALSEGKTRAIAMVPEGNWGDRVLAAFKQEWQAAGATLMGVERIGKPQAINGQLARLLKVNDQQHSRRQDIDFMFLAANSQQARLIKPVLGYQYAGELPVYATSSVYTGSPTPNLDSDLERIQFCDIPWLFNSNDQLRRQITQQWPQANGPLGRLYAMGADAYRLTLHLPQMQAVPGSGFAGLSGTLSLGPNRHVQRKLTWAVFRNGLAVPVTPTSL